MKKIFALLLIVAMLFSFAACNREQQRQSGVASGPIVDKNTLDIVDNAFKVTQEHLSSAKALGYKINLTTSEDVMDVVTSLGLNSSIKYIDGENGKVFAVESKTELGERTEKVQLYSDGVKHYGYKVGGLYELTGKDVEPYIAEQFALIKLWDTTGFKAVNTYIVDTASNGHAFVIEYDVNDESLSLGAIIGQSTNTELGDVTSAEGVKITNFRASGIINASGKLESEKVEVHYEYTKIINGSTTSSEDASSTESDKTSSKETESETVTSVESQNEAKAVAISGKLVIDISLDYDISEVKVPDMMTAITQNGGEGEGDGEGDEEAPKISEISIPDFLKLTEKIETSDDNKANTSSQNKTGKK